MNIDFEEKKYNPLTTSTNKFSYFGYVGQKLYPVFVDEINNVHVFAETPKDFLHCVKKMTDECIDKQMIDMLDFTEKYKVLCKHFEYDGKFSKNYLQKSVDYIFEKYNLNKIKNHENVR